MNAKATIRTPEMNKTEEKYAWLLEVRRRAGEITRYDFGKVTFKLGDDCRYTPDFMVVRSDLVIEFHEVKGGFEREDAMVKRKTAAEQLPFIFMLARYDKGQWTVTEIKGA